MSYKSVIFDIPFIGIFMRMQNFSTPLTNFNILTNAIKMLEEKYLGPDSDKFVKKYKKRSDRLKEAIKFLKKQQYLIKKLKRDESPFVNDYIAKDANTQLLKDYNSTLNFIFFNDNLHPGFIKKYKDNDKNVTYVKKRFKKMGFNL